jgi:hypothetical protein
MALAQDHITEEHVVSILNGMPPTMVPEHPPGFAVHVTLSPPLAGDITQERMTRGAKPPEQEALYKSLIPLARALEADVLRSSRYIVRLIPTTSLPIDQASRSGQHLADMVEFFFTTYFAIPRERLRLQVIPPPILTVVGPAVTTLEPQRWRLEVRRQK